MDLDLINADGSVRTYVVVNLDEEKILASCNNAVDAIRCSKRLRVDGAGEIEVFNLTYEGPDWLKAMIRSDAAYCARRAADFEAEAAAFRQQAAMNVSDAEEMEGRAAAWRKHLAAIPVPDGPTGPTM